MSGAFLSHDRDPEVAASSPGELLFLELASHAIVPPRRGYAAIFRCAHTA
jgi:CelD/BcsL family acetyltransferase involved in cellulose biosynthesis